MKHFSQKSEEEIKKIELQLFKNDNRRSFEFLYNLWKSFVDEVETGYVGIIYDYENDLFGRNTLETFLDSSSEELKIELLSLIEPLDSKFKQVTSPVTKPISVLDKKERDPQKYFWFYRVPKNLTPDLARDLDENGRK